MSRSTVVRILRWITLIGVFGGLLMPMIFIKQVIFPFVFSKLILFQILIGLTFPAYILLAWMEPEYRPKKHPLLLAICAYFVAMGLSVVFSVDIWRSWWGNQERMNGLFTLLHFLAWLLMIIGTLRTWKDWEAFLRFQVIVGGAVALTAIWQHWVNPDLFLYHAVGRNGGVLDNPIYMGMYQMFMFFVLILLALKTRVRAWWAVYGVVTILAIGGFIAAESRGPLVGFFAGLIAAAFFFGVTSTRRRNRGLAVGAVATAFLGYGILYLARGTAIVAELGLTRFTDFASTASTRFIAWKIAWQAFLERPVFGWGLDSFHIIFNTHYNPISLRYTLYETWFDRAHNTVLDVISMTGGVGVITYFGIFIAMFWTIYHAYKKGWIDHTFASLLVGLPVAYFVQNLFVFDHPAGFTLSYLMFGLTIAATTSGFASDAHEVTSTPSESKKFPTVFAIPLVLVALLTIWRASILPFEASALTIEASQYFPQPVGLQKIQQAMEIWTPYRDEQMFLLSRSLVGAGQNLTKVPSWQSWLDIAKTASDQEASRHPMNAYTHYIYARLLGDTAFAVQSQTVSAEDQFKLAIKYSPLRQQLHEGLSRLYLNEGRTEDALKELKAVQDADPQNGYGDWVTGVVQLFDLQHDQIGANLIYSAVTKPFPYTLTGVRDNVPVFYAYRILGKGKDLDVWANQVADDTSAGDTVYYQLAYQSRLAGRADLEKRFVDQVERLFPGSKIKYEQSVAQIEHQTVTAPTSTPAPAKTNSVKAKK